MSIRKFLLGIALYSIGIPAFAISSYPGQWQTVYPSSTTLKGLPSQCQLCHLSSSGGSNFNQYGSDVKTGLGQGLQITAAIKAAESMPSVSAPGTTYTNLQEITAGSQPGWTATSASLPSGFTGPLDPGATPPTCTPPQILVNGVCTTPPPPPPVCVPPQILQNNVCVTPTPPPVCTPPKVLQNNVCVNPPPPPPPITGTVPPDVTACGGGYPFAGYDTHNDRWVQAEKSISVSTVNKLALQASYTMPDSILPTLTTQGGFVYAPDKAGDLSKIDIYKGTAVWTVKAATLMGLPTAIIRTAPAICGSVVIVAGWSTIADNLSPSTAYVMALNQSDGSLKWKVLIDSDKGSRIYQSPIVYKNIVYVGVGGLGSELNALFAPGGAAPTIRGSVVALNIADGSQVWKTYTVPPGYSGGGVWGNTLSIDEKRGVIYAGTGNNYSIPPASMACIAELGTDAGQLCQDPANHIDGIMAMNLATGAILWHKQMLPWDSYGCGSTCTAVPGAPDYDFPNGPIVFSTTVNGKSVDIVGAGHKNGAYVALNRANGDIVWAKKTGPASIIGGIERECATDGVTIYCPEMNFANLTATLVDGTTTTGGFWTALNASTGAILWQKANPTGAASLSPVTLANGVLFGCSLDPTGICYAFNAGTGAILWQQATGKSNGGGIAVYNGRIYIGTGYGALDPILTIGNGGGVPNKVLVYSLPNQPNDPVPGGTTCNPPKYWQKGKCINPANNCALPLVWNSADGKCENPCPPDNKPGCDDAKKSAVRKH